MSLRSQIVSHLNRAAVRFPIAVPGFPSAIHVFALTHSRRKVGSRQR
jgi:hypothetical protein